MVATQTDTSAASKRLDPKFTAAWIVAAAHHGVREARIARQPILLLSAPRRSALPSCSAWLAPDEPLQGLLSKKRTVFHV